MFTDRHRALITELQAVRDPSWGALALLACLTRLRDGGPTSADHVAVQDAWATEDEFRVVYDSPWGPRVGIVRHRFTTVDRLDASASSPAGPTPEEFGREVADFNIGEPLGSYAFALHYDDDGLGWWGDTAVAP